MFFFCSNKRLMQTLIVTLGFVFLSSYSFFKFYGHPNMTSNVGVDFEVFGKVQGVFFRKFTQQKAEELSITGWCMNTKQGTVVGRLEGDKQKIEEMKEWLRVTGSPQSSIQKARFENEQIIQQPSYSNFSIKKKNN